MFGVKTFYRREEDGSLSLKLEGELKDVPLFEQVCVLKEVDLHYKWAPFCSSSMTIADLDKLDTVGWFVIGLANFGLSRDGVFRVIGCDNILEDGSIIIAGQGIRDLPEGAPAPRDTYLCDDPILEKLDIPPIPTRRGGGRMTIRTVEAVIHVTSPTSARTRLVANLDPNMTFLPQPLLEFVMKNLAGVLLARLQTAAKKIPRNPVSNEHARRMRDEEDFYRHWLMKKFQAVCDFNGWEMPPVSAFELTEEQLRKDHQLAEKRAQKDRHRRAVSFDIPVDDSVLGSDRPDFRRLNSAPEHSDTSPFESDAVSELTNKSNRTSTFSIQQALRNREERKIQKKEEKVAQQRLMAAERLRPKELSPEKQKRLEELRSVKAARIEHDLASESASISSNDPRVESEPVHQSRALPTSPLLRHSNSAPVAASAASTPSSRDRRRTSVSEKVTDRLYHHGPFTRLLVLLVLTVVLFVLLHPKLLLTLVLTDLIDSYTQYSSVLKFVAQSAGFLGYLLVCTVAHFALCDIALVYAFDSLELGSKAGRQLRKFYSVKVRLGVALGSFGIAGVAVAKSLFRILLRYACWSGVRLWEYFSPLVPSYVENTAAVMSTPFAVAFELVGNSARLIVNSNPITRPLGVMVFQVLDALSSFCTSMYSFATESVSIVNGQAEATPWYEESFILAKLLFSYTAVFLVTALVLFHLSAKNAAASRIKGVLPDGDDLSTLASVSELDSRSQVNSRGRLGSDLIEIPENNTVTNGLKHPGTISAGTLEEDVSMTSTQKRRKGLLRRRRS